MSATDRLYDFTPPMTRAGLTTTNKDYLLALVNEIVNISVSATPAVTDLLVMADGNAWDGTGGRADLLAQDSMWCVIEAAGADVYYRCRPDNVSSMTATSQGEKVPDGDSVRFKVAKGMRYIETVASAPGNLKKRFSNSPVV